MAYRYVHLRLDRAGVKTTPQGFLRIPATFSRTGIQTYRRADGTAIQEYRPEGEVFHPDSLASLQGAPVTDDHPNVPVTPQNFKQLSIGWIGDTVRRDGNKTTGEIVVADQKAIQKVQDGQLVEVSLGYSCNLDPTPGTCSDGRYDAIQRDIRGNHAALGPEGWGRAGREVRLRLDSEDAVSYLDGPEESVEQTAPAGRKEISMRKIEINGAMHEVEDSVAMAYEAANKADRADRAKVEAERDALKERADQQSAEAEKRKDSEEFSKAVEARVALIADAMRVVGDQMETGGSDREIMERALTHDRDDLDLSDRSDEYVAARFDLLLESAAEAEQNKRDAKDSKARTRKDAVKAPDTAAAPEARKDAKSARADMLKRNADASSEPLAIPNKQ